jgi:hypothetical protein
MLLNIHNEILLYLTVVEIFATQWALPHMEQILKPKFG